ncbi:MAG TPA: hypothetical protein VFR14_08540 [Candidatus Limnocylindrales bacterium]|nr:hypothetical protein [Candidatus Limnocylindrales bacterium]
MSEGRPGSRGGALGRALGRAHGRSPGAALLRLYPADWRSRYGDEMAAVLEARPPALRDRLDLARGALDAWLHPARRSALPAYLSLAGGALWTGGALVVLGQPVSPDWPGYLVDMLPQALLAAIVLAAASIGVWLRLGDGASRFARLALQVALAGHLVWAVALGAAILRIDYGPTTAIAATAAAIGLFLVSVALLRADDHVVGGLLVAAPVALLVAWAPAWIGFGLAWSAVGLIQLRDAIRRPGGEAGMRVR